MIEDFWLIIAPILHSLLAFLKTPASYAIILALSAFLISLLGTRLVILALRKRTILLDKPNWRSNHKMPTPKGGGIAVIFAMVICLLIADIGFGVVLALFLLAAVSLLDDMIGIPILVRLLLQVFAVSIPLSQMPSPLLYDSLPLWLDHVFIGIAWVWFTNLFNFMDGIDGISGSETISIGGGICIIALFAGTFSEPLSLYALIAASAACGFLWWNWHPAKIFLGDVGSIPIGFFMAYLLLLTAASGYSYAAAILPAYYVADGGITLLRRLREGKKIWEAHSEHYYQRAVRRGRRHDTVVRYIIGINLLLVLLATLSVLQPDLAIFNLGLAYMAVFMMLGYFAHTGPHPEHDQHF